MAGVANAHVEGSLGRLVRLEQAGEMLRLTTDEAIEAARTQPPARTRAALRGALVERFAGDIGSPGRIGVASSCAPSRSPGWPTWTTI